MFLRRRTPNATATPAWMEEVLKDMPLEEQQQRRTELFDVSWQIPKAIAHSILDASLVAALAMLCLFEQTMGHAAPLCIEEILSLRLPKIGVCASLRTTSAE